MSQDAPIFNHTMLRVRDPEASVAFYRDAFGMQLVRRLDFEPGKFSLYFLAMSRGDATDDTEASFGQAGVLELTHNWGTESDPEFPGYHNGNDAPQGFGHIAFTVPDVDAICVRLDEMGADFVKRPEDGVMKGIAFVKDPDGYWVEILSLKDMRAMLGG